VVVPDEVRKCVAFLGYRPSGGAIRLAGTCFFVARDIPGTDRTFAYAVTAKHIIDKIRDKGCNKVQTRLNLKDGKAKWVESDIALWKFHPDEEEAVDAAVTWVNIDDRLDHNVYPLTAVANHEVIREQGIGVGEEVFFPGLFAHHYGKDRNVPIIRVGNIAAMPEEKVETPFGIIDAYLVEARSIGGLSGSPVFAHLGPITVLGGELRVAGTRSGVFYLLGLMQGHFAPFSVDLDNIDAEVDVDDAQGIKDRINMGIAIVVPVDRILEVINQPGFREKEDVFEREIKEAMLPVLDIASDIPD
jgi:hypothetical protein